MTTQPITCSTRPTGKPTGRKPRRVDDASPIHQGTNHRSRSGKPCAAFPAMAIYPAQRAARGGRQTGFTLIELVIIVFGILGILGILSAFALRRFFDLSADARAARVNASLGAARSALAIVNAKARLTGIGIGEVAQELTLQDKKISVKFGYPEQPFSLLIAAGMEADFDGAGADGIVHKNTHDMGTGRCGFRYIAPTAAGEVPRLEPWPCSSLPVTAADCTRS